MIKLALFSHDAGGSELLLELSKAFFGVYEFHIFCIRGSSCLNLFKQKNIESHLHIIENSKKFIFTLLDKVKPDVILYSTGWQNHIEYFFLQYAKKSKIPSMAFLDHWTNYRERFGYPQNEWKQNLPTYIAVHDEVSKKMAAEFGFVNIVLIKNYALLSQLKEIQTLNAPMKNTLLFLSEPTTKVAKTTFNNPLYWGFNEKDLFLEIKKHQHLFECDDILIRIHPSDSPNVYKNIDPNINISTHTLSYDIKTSKIIIGVDTIALRLAYLVGKPVIALIPSKNRNFCVPLPKKNQLRSLKSFNINSVVLNRENTQDHGIDFAVFLKKILG